MSHFLIRTFGTRGRLCLWVHEGWVGDYWVCPLQLTCTLCAHLYPHCFYSVLPGRAGWAPPQPFPQLLAGVYLVTCQEAGKTLTPIALRFEKWYLIFIFVLKRLENP